MGILADRIDPKDIRTDTHYRNTFGQAESESAALIVVMFLQDRDARHSWRMGWKSFTRREIDDYVKRDLEWKGGVVGSNGFNALVRGDRYIVHTEGENGRDDEFAIRDEFIAMVSKFPKFAVGDVKVCPAGTENPYETYLAGDERVAALRAFRAGELPEGVEAWHAPCGGGASKFTSPEAVAWG